MIKLCVFAGSSAGQDPLLVDLVKRIGAMAAARGIGIVYGGGRTGLMGALADGATDAQGYVHGIIPKFLENLEVAHQGVSDLTITTTMHERKTIMYDEGDAFLVLPGGFGTMEEVMEIITWRQLKSHNKPIMLFNYEGYWDSLISMWHQASEHGFIRPAQLNLADSIDDLDGIADFLDGLQDG